MLVLVGSGHDTAVAIGGAVSGDDFGDNDHVTLHGLP